MNSKNAKRSEKTKIKIKLFNFKKQDNKKTGRAINKARKDGIKIIEIGIKTLS